MFNWKSGEGIRTGVACLLLMAIVFTVGCQPKKPETEVLTLDDAKIEKINLKSDTTGTIQVKFYSERHKQEIVDEGEITSETEIVINGAQSTLKDLRVGERVRGEVRIENANGKKRRVAVQIIADRPKPAGG
ncbi:MAG: hypothetical protein ACPGXK_09300 [Phycisphaerae bacterium]